METIQKRQTIWNKMFNKANRTGHITTYDIAQETNIPEEKVKEILDGERELPHNKIDAFIEVIQNTSKTSKNAKRNEAILFFHNNNPKELRLKFNYNSQKEVAKLLDISQFTISRLEDANYGPSTLSTKILCKLYNFYNNELNIKINKGDTMNKDNYKVNYKIDDEELKLYMSKIKRENIKDLIKKEYSSVNEFAKKIDINPSTIDKFAKGQINWSPKMYKKVYNGLFNNTTENIKNENIINIPAKSVDFSSIDNVDENWHAITPNELPTREIKNKDLYNYNEPCTINQILTNNFTPEVIFNYLIDNCKCRNVVELYRLLDNYFKN